MPSSSPSTQIWANLRGIPQIWVNPQIWMFSENDHPELREVTLGSPELSALPPIFLGGHLPVYAIKLSWDLPMG